VGINSGTVVAGVIGKHRFHYDFWGDPVNNANRMESHGLPGQIQMSTTKDLIKDKFESRGMMDIKGIGEMETSLLTDGRSGESDQVGIVNSKFENPFTLSMVRGHLLDAT
jgi:class 3 adenylate cyclase